MILGKGPLSRFFSFAVFGAQEQVCAVWGAEVCPPPGLPLTLSPPLPRNNNIPFFFPAVLWIPPAVLAHTPVIFVPFVLCMTKQ